MKKIMAGAIWKKNKGAALVAVLVGILFISILASSLMYLVTVNYRMKGMRLYSSDNFYTAEFALNELLSQTRQYCSAQSGDSQEKLESLLKGPASASGTQHFNRSNLQSLISVDSSVVDGLVSVSVNSVYDYDPEIWTYKVDNNQITIRGLTITTVARVGGGDNLYESSITTDLVFTFPPSAGDPGRLNDFSILSDAPLRVSTSNQYIGGNIYARANGKKTSGGHNNAMEIGSGGVVTLMSTFAFLQGDLTIEDKGVLFVAGNCTVMGDVDIKGTGQLLVTGKLVVKGSITGNYRVSDSGKIEQGSTSVNWDYYQDNFDNGLAGKLARENVQVHYNDTEGGKNVSVNQVEFAQHLKDGEKQPNKAVIDGVEVGAVYMKHPVIHNYVNTLIISSATENHLDNAQGVTNCTYININPNSEINFTIKDKAISWGTMDDKSYAAAKQLFIWDDAKDAIPGAPGNITYAAYGENLSNVVGDTINGKTVKNYSGNSYYEDVTGNQLHNYITFGDLLVEDIGGVLGGFMSGGAADGGVGEGVIPTINIQHWTKE